MLLSIALLLSESNRNYLTNLFLAEFGSLLEQYVSDDPASLLIAGDFNFYVDNSADKTSQDFLALIDSFNLKQHVLSPTHHAGHTLDLLITRADDDLVTSLSTYDADFSDHFVVNCNLTIEKPSFTKKDIYFRACKTINMDLFLNDLQESCLLRNPPDDLNELVALYDSDLAEILNKHAPMKKLSVTIRPAAPWYSEEIKLAKRKKRQLERRWRATRSLCDREAYSHQCKALKTLLSASRRQYYLNLVTENQSNVRSLFLIFSKLLHRRCEAKYPKHDTPASLANDFIFFFRDKIRKIRHDIDQVAHKDSGAKDCTTDCQLNRFWAVSSSELLNIISSTSFKSCELDPVPGHVLKCLLPAILPIIIKIVNISLESGRMPELFKQAIIKPLLKKPSLDPGEFKNFRLISNLRFISKIIEKCVAKQLTEYLNSNGLCETFQSAYRSNHSTETALIRVFNDIALDVIDRHNSVILILLDLSAAFDTVDHNILLTRLLNSFGISGTSLDWFQSYTVC